MCLGAGGKRVLRTAAEKVVVAHADPDRKGRRVTSGRAARGRGRAGRGAEAGDTRRERRLRPPRGGTARQAVGRGLSRGSGAWPWGAPGGRTVAQRERAPRSGGLAGAGSGLAGKGLVSCLCEPALSPRDGQSLRAGEALRGQSTRTGTGEGMVTWSHAPPPRKEPGGQRPRPPLPPSLAPAAHVARWPNPAGRPGARGLVVPRPPSPTAGSPGALSGWRGGGPLPVAPTLGLWAGKGPFLVQRSAGSLPTTLALWRLPGWVLGDERPFPGRVKGGAGARPRR